MNLANLLPVVIASLTALALALPNLKKLNPPTQSQIAQQEAITSLPVVKSPYNGTARRIK